MYLWSYRPHCDVQIKNSHKIIVPFFLFFCTDIISWMHTPYPWLIYNTWYSWFGFDVAWLNMFRCLCCSVYTCYITVLSIPFRKKVHLLKQNILIPLIFRIKVWKIIFKAFSFYCVYIKNISQLIIMLLMFKLLPGAFQELSTVWCFTLFITYQTRQKFPTLPLQPSKSQNVWSDPFCSILFCVMFPEPLYCLFFSSSVHSVSSDFGLLNRYVST